MLFVFPAKAGIQGPKASAVALDPRLRGGDGYRVHIMRSILSQALSGDLEQDYFATTCENTQIRLIFSG
jgi:hypothetical protein